MAERKERSQYERETLVFKSPEDAGGFRQRVEQGEAVRLRPGASRRARIERELQEEFARAGETVGTIKTPWEHTLAEHAEVQQLVDVAFAQDLPAAVRQAKKSGYYPRNLDLLHDVLTGEMYELMQQHGLQRQPLGWMLLAGASVLVGTLLLVYMVLVWLA